MIGIHWIKIFSICSFILLAALPLRAHKTLPKHGAPGCRKSIAGPELQEGRILTQEKALARAGLLHQGITFDGATSTVNLLTKNQWLDLFEQSLVDLNYRTGSFKKIENNFAQLLFGQATRIISSEKFQNHIRFLSKIDRVSDRHPDIKRWISEFLNASSKTIQFEDQSLWLSVAGIEGFLRHWSDLDLKEDERFQSFVSGQLLGKSPKGIISMLGIRHEFVNILVRYFAYGYLPFTEDHIRVLYELLLRPGDKGPGFLYNQSLTNITYLLSMLSRLKRPIPLEFHHELQRALKQHPILNGEDVEIDSRTLSILIEKIFGRGIPLDPQFLEVFTSFLFRDKGEPSPIDQLISDRDYCYMIYGMIQKEKEVRPDLIFRYLDRIYERRIAKMAVLNTFELLDGMIFFRFEMRLRDVEAFIQKAKNDQVFGQLDSVFAGKPKKVDRIKNWILSATSPDKKAFSGVSSLAF